MSYYVKEDRESGTWTVVDEKGKVVSKDHRIRREAIRAMADLSKKPSKPIEGEDDDKEEDGDEE